MFLKALGSRVGGGCRGGFESLDFVGLLPREDVAAEVTKGSALLVDRLLEVELGDQLAGGEGEVLADEVGEALVGEASGAKSVDVDRDRLSDADSVGELNFALAGEARSDEVLGDVASGVRSGAVNLGRIFSGEGAAAVTTFAAVGVDDDLTSRESSVALGATDHEASGGVDVDDGLVVEELSGADRLDDLLKDLTAHLLKSDAVTVLRGDDDGVDMGGFAVDVFDGDLGFHVGEGPVELAAVAEFGVLFDEAVREVNGERHEGVGLVAGVAKHEALVASALLFVESVAFVDALSDVWGLAVEVNEDRAVVGVEADAWVGVADFANGVADNFCVVDEGAGGDLSSDDDESGLHEGFTSHAAVGVFGEDGIENGI